MKQKAKNKYDVIYAENENRFGFGEPIPVVRKIPTLLSGGNALDVGAGQGRNSIFLAQNGFSVTAIDTSTVGLKQLQKQINTEGLPIRATYHDIRDGIIDIESYNVVVFSLVLQNFLADESKMLIQDAQKKAPAGTFHAVGVFTSDGDLYKDPKRKDYFFPAPGELRELYKGWIIHDYIERTSKAYAKKEDGTQMKNITSFILAQAVNI